MRSGVLMLIGAVPRAIYQRAGQLRAGNAMETADYSQRSRCLIAILFAFSDKFPTGIVRNER